MGLVYRQGLLHFGEKNLCPLLPVAKSHEHPFFIYDVDGMRARAKALKNSYPNLNIHYAMKANASARLLRTFREEGTGVDVVSGGEIECSLKAGFAPEHIIFSG